MLDEKTLTELKRFLEINLKNKSMTQIEQKIDYNIYESPLQINQMKSYVENHRKPSFQQLLFQLIDEKGASDTDIYKKAWIDRRHFSKIRSNPNYRIGKNTAIALALALELTLASAEELLEAAGFSLSDSDTSDLIIKFCLKNKIYNLHDVNEALEYLNEKPITNHS